MPSRAPSRQPDQRARVPSRPFNGCHVLTAARPGRHSTLSPLIGSLQARRVVRLALLVCCVAAARQCPSPRSAAQPPGPGVRGR